MTAVNPPLWIRCDEATVKSLDGSAKIDGKANSIKRLIKTMARSEQEIVAWAKSSGHHVVRARRGSAYRFYVIPQDANVSNFG